MSEVMLTGSLPGDKVVSAELTSTHDLSGSVFAQEPVSGAFVIEAQLSGDVSFNEPLAGDIAPIGEMTGDLAAAYGTQGIPGKQGLSAYEVAVKNGFQGTEQEWLESLVGESGKDGAPGQPGKDGLPGRDGLDGQPGRDGLDGQPGADGLPGRDGADGKDGSPGRDGVTPHIGENGNWFIDDVDTGICAVGKDGQDGKDGSPGRDGIDGQPGAPGRDGIDGESGKDGTTPHIGENGNWFVGEIDTGVCATGEAGQPGKDGSPGADGQPGKDGVSPVISVSDIDGGHRVVVVDESGEKIFDVMNGSDGAPGAAGKDGDPGKDGYTPQRGTDYWTEADKQAILAELAAQGSAGIKSEIVVLSDVQLIKGALLENQIITFPTKYCNADNYICKFLISSWPKETWADAFVFNVHSDCTYVIGTPGTLFAYNQFGLATMATQKYDLIAQFIYYDK